MIRNFRKENAIKTLSTFLLLLAGPVFGQSDAEIVVRFTGFLGDLRLSTADVRADLLGDDPDTRRIAVAMDETATAAFALFTTTHVNQSVSFFVCGEEVETATVQAPIETGFALTGPIPLERATAFVAALNGLQDCPD